MSDSQGSEYSDDDTPLPLLPEPEPEPEPTVTLAKICMIDENGKIDDWDGKEPNGKRLFVYPHIGYTTYHGYFRNKRNSYEFMRPSLGNPKKLQGTSFLHCDTGSIILALMQGTPNFNTAEPYYCRIYKDNYTDTFWYKLYGYDDKPNTTEITKIRSVKESELGNPGSTTEQYTPYCGYFPGGDLYIFRRECNQTYKPLKGNTLKGISKDTKKRNLPRSLRRGGGKTRRKFKVKKRRNRRIRNTMKRRKTAVKRRNR
jgi:hypothetical protein